ncbi:MAG: DnaD domain protein [Lachnospiraceae bacterium]|nr:DnaD domain protein [Lachnospiraceae bacterium]MBQ2407354.1 DnaD domain protein [Lachnospiraceae bacterium]MBQ5851262.1 DnaD domain protein [Lachnospiraceae bacterium]MEE0918757.1 DnaD domain protein [Lachnospiraceae bacterium]
MNRVNIYRSVQKQDTAISNIFIDEYMSEANDAQLKIYLFLTRMMSANMPTCVADIADKFNYTEKDVLRALIYWESKNLLSLEFDAADNLTRIEILSLENSYNAMPRQTTPQRITPVLSFVRPAGMQNNMRRNSMMMSSGRTADRRINNNMTASVTNTPAENVSVSNTACASSEIVKPEYSLDELKNFKSNEEAEQILMITEQYLGRQLGRSDMETILFIYDKLKFSPDLIDYLVQYCVERGKKDLRYIEKVALKWHEQEITTPDEAKLKNAKYDKSVYAIMKALGKNSNPAPKELEYIEKWTKEYGFLMDVIQEACDKTVMTTDTHRFAYADGILKKWYEAGVHHKSDIPVVDAAFKKINNATPKTITSTTSTPRNKFNSFTQNTYDFDQLEKTLLSN